LRENFVVVAKLKQKNISLHPQKVKGVRQEKKEIKKLG
jgi:hypothetical protein